MIGLEDLHALADNEVSADERAHIEAALRQDAKLQAEYESILDVKRALSTHIEPQSCMRTWAACTDRLKELDQKKKVETFVGKYAWSMCASIFLLIVGAGLYTRQSGGSTVATSDVAKLMSGLTPFSQPVNDRQEDMASWVKDVSNGANIQDSNSIRITRYAKGLDEFGRPATAFALADARGSMSLVIVKGARSVGGAEPMVDGSNYYSARIGERNCIMWTDQDFGFTLVGVRSHEELLEAAKLIRR